MSRLQASIRRDYREQSRQCTDPFLGEILGFLGLEPLVLAPPLPEPGLIRWCAQDDPWLERLQPKLAKLNTLAPPPSPPTPSRFLLGRHVESLARWLTEHVLDAELIAHNLPICDIRSEEPKRTIGELDLVYRLTSEKLIRHRELAAKWYLYDPSTASPANTEQAWASAWWGPMRRDRLDLKLTRMTEHQLALGQHPATRERLGEQSPDLHELWLNGQLFWPLDTRGPAPTEVADLQVNPLAISGHWARYQQWCRSDWLHAQGGRWYILDKKEWLRTRHGLHHVQPYDPDPEAPWPHPRLLAHALPTQDGESWVESMRVFVVPNDWGQAP